MIIDKILIFASNFKETSTVVRSIDSSLLFEGTYVLFEILRVVKNGKNSMLRIKGTFINFSNEANTFPRFPSFHSSNYFVYKIFSLWCLWQKNCLYAHVQSRFLPYSIWWRHGRSFWTKHGHHRGTVGFMWFEAYVNMW